MTKTSGNSHGLPLQVACIGLGAKGSFIARKVVASGVSTVLYDLDDSRAECVSEPNVRRATSLTDALAGSTFIITAFANTGEYEDAYLETEGILKRAETDAFVVDMTPITPHLAIEVQQLGVINGLHMIDGWMASAITTIPGREPSIFLGGEPSDLKIAVATMKSFKIPVIPCAAPGTGKSMGISSLIMHVSSILGVVEALSFAENQGISRADAARYLEALDLHSDLFDAYSDKIIHDDYDGSYSVTRLLSELEVCFEAAESRDLTFPGLENAYQLYRLLSIIGGYEKDVAALQLIYGDEETCARQGLDWSRAAQLSGEDLDHDHTHDHEHAHDHDHDHEHGYGQAHGSRDGIPRHSTSPDAESEDDDEWDDEWDEDDSDYDDIIADGFDALGDKPDRRR